MANVCLPCGSLGLQGCGGAGVCATRAVHKAICNSHLQGDNIPVPAEGSFDQVIPVSSILCWLTQEGAGQSAASPGAWKKPRCQHWCENTAQCPSVLPLQLWSVSPIPPCPAPGAPQQRQIPQVLPEQEHNRKGCRALSTADICSSRDSETKDPADKDTPSAHGPGC